MGEVSDLPFDRYDDRAVDAGQVGIDAILSEVLAQVDEVMHEQVRLRLLVDAVVSLNADLSLDTILAGLAETAARLVDAKQAAIAVFSPGPEWRLRTFVQRGMTAGEAQALAGLSGETGLLDQLLEDGVPVRLRDLLGRADAAGIPRDRVPVASFLGVPVQTRTEVFGVLYLADRLTDGDFTDHDETLMVALATAAGVAIDNARLHDETTTRQRWLAATADAMSLLATTDPDSSLPGITRAARTASGADLTWIVTGDSVASLRLHALVDADGDVADHDLGTLDLSESLVAEALRSGAPVVVDDLATDDRAAVAEIPFGRAVVVPLRSDTGVEGALGFGWHHDRADALDESAAPMITLAETFAQQVALALQAARSREEGQRLALLEDRGRIGTDLQGRVIQRLFGVGLGLEAVSRLVERPAASARLADAVADLDGAIADLRRSVFDLGPQRADDVLEPLED